MASKSKKLLIVESPAKARTISKYLGSDYVVESSIGHVRDLPSAASEIPVKYKNLAWARLGVDVNDHFKPLYIIPRGKKEQVRKLKSLLMEACELLLATDVDREGEAIAWHLKEVLKPKCPVKRMTFEEITRTAIVDAVETTRDIDEKLVHAQETRRVLDRLFGYEVSPILWKKVKPKLSAGRVQSVATRLVVVRERARIAFVEACYWDLVAHLDTAGPEGSAFSAPLRELGGKRVARGKDFDDVTGCVKDQDAVILLDEQIARSAAAALGSSTLRIDDVAEKSFSRHPYPPFITSTLQQEAARKLRFNTHRTMRIAQSLYENGYITYMRTDSVQLSNQAVAAARQQVAEMYGNDYLPETPRIYKSRSKNAQEAHEAIRPAGDAFRTPKSVESALDNDSYRLYELIWKRTVASQMKDARGQNTQVRISGDAGVHGVAVFSATGKVITFPGFLRAYVEGSDDPRAELADRETLLPALTAGGELTAEKIDPVEHRTQPPARFTEASLVKELEERGIGRPSTYASIIKTIRDRGYVFSKGTALVPTFTAFAVVNLLEKHLTDLVDYEFTARMEDGLDAIAKGRLEAEPWLRDFYFGTSGGAPRTNGVTTKGLKTLVSNSSEEIDARAISGTLLGRTEGGEDIVVRVGRYGAYVQIGDSDQRASVPDDIPPDELDPAKALAFIDDAAKGDKVLGVDPDTSKPVYVKTGRFGPYVQLGDPELTEKGKVKRGTKPKMASLWPSMSTEALTLGEALLLLSFPRDVGAHPETETVITAQNGRFGPYIKMGDDSRSLPDHESLATLTLDEAVKIFRQPKKGRGTRGGASLAALGDHPQTGKKIEVKKGRYGPYVTDGTVNASLPKGRDPAEITLDEAVELLADREEKLRSKSPVKVKKAKKAPRKAKKKRADA